VPPQLALCEALIDAGHEVIAVADARLRVQAEQSGMQFEGIAEPPRPVDPSGPEIEQWVLSQKFIGVTYAEATSEGIERHRPERVLVDGMLFSAQVEARAAGVPYAALWHMLVERAEGWAGGVDAIDQEANLASHNTHRKRRGLAKVDSMQDTLLDADWFLALSYEVLNRTVRREWPNLHYVGAPMPRATHTEVELPPGDAPLVLVGFSTTPMGQAAVLQRVADALAGLDVRVLITLGSVRLDELDLPANAIAAPFVPHDQVLPETALTVSHVGHGTMCAAARHGVPILAMPLGRDQNTNAEILTDIGIGEWLPPSSTPAEIAEVAQRLLSDETANGKCAEVAAAISGHNGLNTAIQLVTGPLD
jgi:MGT family glycosyltransferase